MKFWACLKRSNWQVLLVLLHVTKRPVWNNMLHLTVPIRIVTSQHLLRTRTGASTFTYQRLSCSHQLCKVGTVISLLWQRRKLQRREDTSCPGQLQSTAKVGRQPRQCGSEPRFLQLDIPCCTRANAHRKILVIPPFIEKYVLGTYYIQRSSCPHKRSPEKIHPLPLKQPWNWDLMQWLHLSL